MASGISMGRSILRPASAAQVDMVAGWSFFWPLQRRSRRRRGGGYSSQCPLELYLALFGSTMFKWHEILIFRDPFRLQRSAKISRTACENTPMLPIKVETLAFLRNIFLSSLLCFQLLSTFTSMLPFIVNHWHLWETLFFYHFHTFSLEGDASISHSID